MKPLYARRNGCYLCLRYRPSPMSAVCTHADIRGSSAVAHRNRRPFDTGACLYLGSVRARRIAGPKVACLPMSEIGSLAAIPCRCEDRRLAV